MDRAKTRVLISILKDSSLYETLPHEERISLLSRLEKEYPSLFHAKVHGENEDTEAGRANIMGPAQKGTA